MRLPKRNTLAFAVAVGSILKFIGSIKIDTSKQNRRYQLFDRTNLRCAIIDVIFVVSNNRPLSIYNSNTIFCGQFRQKLILTFACHNSPPPPKKKITRRKQRWTTNALDLRNNSCVALVKTKTKTRTQCLLVNTGS